MESYFITNRIRQFHEVNPSSYIPNWREEADFIGIMEKFLERWESHITSPRLDKELTIFDKGFRYSKWTIYDLNYLDRDLKCDPKTASIIPNWFKNQETKTFKRA